MNIVLGAVTRTEFEVLKETTEMMKDNVEKNIDWFYGSLALMIAVTGFGLFAVVQKAIRDGVERGIEETNKSIKNLIDERQPFRYFKSDGNIMNGKFLIPGFALMGFSKENFVSLSIINSNGQVLYTADTVKINDGELIEIDFSQYPDYFKVYYSIIWISEDYLKLKQTEVN